jgi:hypothetical protein
MKQELTEEKIREIKKEMLALCEDQQLLEQE